MLDQLLIFTRGGLILWTYQELGKALRGSPIDALIRTCLLEERSAASSFQYDAPGASYTLKWAFHNDLGLVFVAVYQKIIHLLYIDELLSIVKREFSYIYNPKTVDYPDFDDTFRQLLREAEARAEELQRLKQVKITDSGKNALDQKQGKRSTTFGKQEDVDNGDDGEGKHKIAMSLPKSTASNGLALVPQSNSNRNVHHSSDNSHGSGSDDDGGHKAAGVGTAFNVDKLQHLKSRGGKKGSAPKAFKAPKQEHGTKKAKKNRVWDDAPTRQNLDFSESSDQIKENEVLILENQGKSLMDAEEDDDFGTEIKEELESAGSCKERDMPMKKGWFSSLLQSIAGKAMIEREDLTPALKTLKDRLMVKNVAEEISEELCESVAASLVGKKLGSFTRVSSTVQAAMEEALLRILTPKRSIDILRDVHSAKEQGRPYVVVFCGVNGVGKSTNLAKVAYWLIQHDVNVMMAACDTFRSGAVEQLKTHANRLKISLFQRGYEKDPALVAKEAIREAAHKKVDVVLVDTAGRMQDNEPLMRALAKLVHMNNPDLVLFVGEALVGNDGVDQLMKFNEKLVDLSTAATPRTIDGILLTKFDTVDDKVGAALSMVYKSGAPIMFLGCGQTYTDLKKVNVKSIIKSLLK